jgi:Ni,Fe-hydrogenase III large subunit
VSGTLSGAREGRASWLRRLVARVLARDLQAFVVPGREMARAYRLDLEAGGLRLADTPRHASVLVLLGELPEGLKSAAAVAYAQMLRPRAILGVGAGDVSPLPGPDASAGVEQEDLEEVVAALRRSFAEGAFSPEAPGFDVDEIRTQTEYVCSMHPEVVSDEPGSCPKCGMDLVPRESAGEMDHGQNHAHMDHSRHEGIDQGIMDHGDDSGGHEARGHGETRHGPHEEHDDGSGEHAEHGGHDHMAHGAMGFMSMVEMTKDLPRSSDGLPMEWVKAPFGPLFPGLPGGLSVTLTFDGDTVAEVEAASAVGGRVLRGLTGPAAGFVEGLAGLDPLSPVAYRLLASRAIENATDAPADEPEGLARVGVLERERAASHLGWLASFAHLLGYAWLEKRAAKLQLAVVRAEGVEEIVRLRAEVRKVARRVERTPLLGRKLRGVGRLPGGAETRGPVARAGGRMDDSRAEDEIYLELRFEPVVRDGDDALSRMRVRLEEIERSLDLVGEAGSFSVPRVVLDGALSGAGVARIETPRGAAGLKVELAEGVVSRFELDTPSSKHLELVQAVAEGAELADALVGVASLDISPWEVVR